MFLLIQGGLHAELDHSVLDGIWMIKGTSMNGQPVSFIPYMLWGNRGSGKNERVCELNLLCNHNCRFIFKFRYTHIFHHEESKQDDDRVFYVEQYQVCRI